MSDDTIPYAHRLVDRVAVVTGGASGIGRAMCERFASEGARVAVVDLDEDAGGAVAAAVGGMFVRADVTSSDEVEALYAEVAGRYGGIDVCCNNAGISPPDDDSILETGLEAWDRVQRVNLTSVYLCCKHALPHLLARGRGSIINTASFVAVMGAATSQVSYTASKGGVLAMSRELGVQFARQGVRVNALCPGPVNTPLLQELFAKDPERAARRLVHIPMGRFGEATEIAAAAAFLASDDSSFITAVDLPRRRRDLRRLRHPVVGSRPPAANPPGPLGTIAATSPGGARTGLRAHEVPVGLTKGRHACRQLKRDPPRHQRRLRHQRHRARLGPRRNGWSRWLWRPSSWVSPGSESASTRWRPCPARRRGPGDRPARRGRPEPRATRDSKASPVRSVRPVRPEPAGPTGPPGTLATTSIVGGAMLATGPNPATGTVLVAKTSCPAGSLLLTGSAQVTAPGVIADRNVQLRTSIPLSANVWETVAIVTAPLGQGVAMGMKPYVVCGTPARAVPAKTTTTTTTTTVPTT